MDIVLEFLIQLVVQLVVEVIGDFLLETAFHGVANVLRSRIGRYVIAALVGFGFGLAWGDHLSGNATWPKLLWVSLALSAAALMVAAARAANPAATNPAAGSALRQALTPPWRWHVDRFVGFVVLNLAIAGGIALAFNPGTYPSKPAFAYKRANRESLTNLGGRSIDCCGDTDPRCTGVIDQGHDRAGLRARVNPVVNEQHAVLPPDQA